MISQLEKSFHQVKLSQAVLKSASQSERNPKWLRASIWSSKINFKNIKENYMSKIKKGSNQHSKMPQIYQLGNHKFN